MPGAHLFAEALAAGTAEEPLAAISAPAFVDGIRGCRQLGSLILLFSLPSLLFRDLLALSFQFATFAFESAFFVGHALAFLPYTLLFQRFGRQPFGVINLHLANHSLRTWLVGGGCGVG